MNLCTHLVDERSCGSMLGQVKEDAEDVVDYLQAGDGAVGRAHEPR